MNNNTTISSGIPITIVPLFFVVTALVWSLQSFGQAAGEETYKQEIKADNRVIEEIIVSAQKRDEAIQDVPISMSVVTDEFMAEQGITDIQGAMRHVPNMEISPTGDELDPFSVAPRCRGITVGTAQKGFEPPCALAVDGIPYTQLQYFQAALFDLKRIEVLRGPQGTTFGKNSTAGLVHLITKGPTDEFTGHVVVQSGGFNRRRLEGAVGGALLPGLLNFRLAGMSEEQDGFFKNTTAQVEPEAVKRPGSQDRQAFRAKLGFPNLWGSQLMLSFEHADLGAVGVGAEFSDVPPDLMSFLRSADPNADFTEGNYVVSEDTPEEVQIEIETFQAEWNYNLFGWDIDALAAHSELDQTKTSGEGVPVPGVAVKSSDVNPTMTFEARAFSPSLPGLFGLQELFGWNLGHSNLLAGGFYQQRKIEDSEYTITLGHRSVAGIVLFGPGGGLPDINLFPLPTDPTTGETFESSTVFFNQNAETIAGFAQFQWHLRERWMLQYGMRLSEEKKQAKWDVNLSDPAPILRATGWQEFKAQKSIREFQFQPKVTLNYEPIDDISLFAHWARGFKGGGFNAAATRGEDDQGSVTGGNVATPLSFDPEVATEWGLDAKMRLLDGTMQLNVSLFRMEFEDFQVLTRVRDPNTNLVIAIIAVNAAKVRAQGIEADLSYRPVYWLTLIGALGVNETKYIDFPIGPCPAGEEDTEGDDPRCDQSGRPLPFSPKINSTLTLNVRYPLRFLGLENTDITAGTTVEYVDEQFLDEALTPELSQASFVKVAANIGLSNQTQGWSFQIIGQNLTDELTFYRKSTSGIGTRSNAAGRRIVFGQLSWNF